MEKELIILATAAHDYAIDRIKCVSKHTEKRIVDMVIDYVEIATSEDVKQYWFAKFTQLTPNRSELPNSLTP